MDLCYCSQVTVRKVFGMYMQKSRDTQGKMPSPKAIWNTFDQVTVQETFSQADANRVSSGFGGVGFCWFPSVK